MSDAKQEFKELMDKQVESDKAKSALQAKKLILETRKVEQALSQIEQSDKDLEIAKNTRFDELSPEYIEALQKNNNDYIEAAKEGMNFINSEFKGVVPFFRKNLILIGASSGEGKSTAIANIAYSLLSQKNPTTGQGRKVLVITNEEKAEDFYNRVVCLFRGWHYVNHDQITNEQQQEFNSLIPKLAKNGRLTVVSDDYNGTSGLTTTLEGVQTIFDNLIRDNTQYDAILIDYYQNIKESKTMMNLKDWEIQSRLVTLLDQYKNIYPAPIVLMAQLEKPDKDKKKPFSLRLFGRKSIFEKATVAIEMTRDNENLRTEWTIHKSRFTAALGQSIFTGYDRGKFVVIDDSFKQKVLRWKESKQMNKINNEGSKE
jgi:replicative DNA helicase